MERRDQWSGEEGEERAGEQKAGKSSNKSPSTPFRLGGLCHFVMLCFLPRLPMCSWIYRQCVGPMCRCETPTNRGFDTCRRKRGRKESMYTF